MAPEPPANGITVSSGPWSWVSPSSVLFPPTICRPTSYHWNILANGITTNQINISFIFHSAYLMMNGEICLSETLCLGREQHESPFCLTENLNLAKYTYTSTRTKFATMFVCVYLISITSRAETDQWRPSVWRPAVDGGAGLQERPRPAKALPRRLRSSYRRQPAHPGHRPLCVSPP